MAEVLFRAKLTRDGSSIPWGFRLQGGVEYGKPLTLLKVVEDSLAAKGGLNPGDIVVKLAGKSAECMTHKDAQDAIISAGNALEIIVERAEVTMTAITTPASPPTPGSDVKDGVHSNANEPIVANAVIKVTDNDETHRNETATETATKAAAATVTTTASETTTTATAPAATATKMVIQQGEAPVGQSPDHDASAESFPDQGRERTTDQGKERTTDQGKERTTDMGEALPPRHDAAAENGDSLECGGSPASEPAAERRVKLAADLENDRISKEPAGAMYGKQAETAAGGEPEAVVGHGAPSEQNTTVERARDVDSAGGSTDATEPGSSLGRDSDEGGLVVCDDAAVINNKVCDSSRGEGQQTIEEAKPTACVDTKQSLPDIKDVASVQSSQSAESSSIPVITDTNSITSTGDRTEGQGVADTAVRYPARTKHGQDKPVSRASAREDGATVCADKTDWPDRNQLPAPSVINEFRSVAGSVKLQAGDNEQTMPPSSSADKEEPLPEDLQTASQTPQTSCQVPHIPHSSPTAVTCTPGTTSSAHTDPISLVIAEVPRVTIEARLIDAVGIGQEHDGGAPSGSTNATFTLHQDTGRASEGVSIRTAPVASVPSSPGVVSVPVRLEQNVGEAVSRQTKAPVEEIIIASKPSLQIVTSAESRETIRIPAGDKRREETGGRQWKEKQDETSTPPPPPPTTTTATAAATTTTVSHEKKDFSKTAPWRMHKQAGSGSSPRAIEKNALHPWRKSRAEHAMSHSLDDRQLSAAANRLTEGAVVVTRAKSPTSGVQTEATPIPAVGQSDTPPEKKPQSTLTYVGKRIESPPVGSPVGGAASQPFFKMAPATTAVPRAGRDTPPPPPSERSNSTPQTTPPSASDPISMPTPSSPASGQYSPQPEQIQFQVAAPDLVDIPMPAVKEMVENLNKRLEAIAVQHPKIVEPASAQELGLNYFKQSGADLIGDRYDQIYEDFDEREIIIDSPPNPNFTGTSLDDIKQRLFGAPSGYYRVADLLEAGGSPGSHRRRFSLPGGLVSSCHRHQPQRRVRFAEPPESSVIEIEPRRQTTTVVGGRRRLWDDDDGSVSDMEDYTSASLLAAKLDRIERENALSTASFQRHRNAKHRAQGMSADGPPGRPAETFREKVISFESLGKAKDDVVLSSLKPSARERFVFGASGSGSRGFSLSIGQNKPGSISLSLTHQRGSGQPPSQVALAVPPAEGHFSYTISPRTGSSEPFAIRYSVPAHLMAEPVVRTAPGDHHAKAPSLDSARTVHVQYPPPEGLPTLPTQLLNQTSSTLSPSQQAMRQLAGRPGIRSPTNYSNTLQIDTSSRLQHRSPSPPNPSYPPNILSDRSHLSPQRLVHPQVIDPDTANAEYQTQRSSSPSQGAAIGIKVRQPSPTNPMAYQRSASPQGVVTHCAPSQNSQQPSLQQTSKYSPIQYQPSTGPHGGTVHQPPSPVPYQQQAARIQAGSPTTYQRSVSPQTNLSLLLQQPTPYQRQQAPGPSPQPRLVRPQQASLQPPGYAPIQQHPPQPQPSPRLSPRPGHAAPGQMQPAAGGSLARAALPGDVQLAGKPAANVVMGGQAAAATAVASGVAYQALADPQLAGPRPQGLFALFDKRFTEKFLQWNEERPGDLCRSETYKLVHEMEKKSDDL